MESYITIENYMCRQTNAQSIRSTVCLSVINSSQVPSQVWYFIVWIPELCLFPYYRYTRSADLIRKFRWPATVTNFHPVLG